MFLQRNNMSTLTLFHVALFQLLCQAKQNKLLIHKHFLDVRISVSDFTQHSQFLLNYEWDVRR